MKKIFRLLLAMASVCVLSVAMSACGEDDVPEEPDQPEVSTTRYSKVFVPTRSNTNDVFQYDVTITADGKSTTYTDIVNNTAVTRNTSKDVSEYMGLQEAQDYIYQLPDAKSEKSTKVTVTISVRKGVTLDKEEYDLNLGFAYYTTDVKGKKYQFNYAKAMHEVAAENVLKLLEMANESNTNVEVRE